MSLSQVGEHRIAEYKEDGSATQRGPRVSIHPEDRHPENQMRQTIQDRETRLAMDRMHRANTYCANRVANVTVVL